MSDPRRGRLLFSTATGRLCPECGAPIAACRCPASRGPSAPPAADTPPGADSPQAATRAYASLSGTARGSEDRGGRSPRLDAAGSPRLTARLRIEVKGRAGKTVTVIDGLTIDPPSLRALATELKKQCGTGGSAGDGTIELQGDRRERLRALLSEKGFRVKG